MEILKSEQTKVGDNGRILLRYSGTEPKNSSLVEGREKFGLKVLSIYLKILFKNRCNLNPFSKYDEIIHAHPSKPRPLM